MLAGSGSASIFRRRSSTGGTWTLSTSRRAIALRPLHPRAWHAISKRCTLRFDRGAVKQAKEVPTSPVTAARGARVRTQKGLAFAREASIAVCARPAQAIIDRETGGAIQGQLKSNGTERQVRSRAKEPSLLADLLVDANGVRLTITHAVKNGMRYRY